MMSRWSIVILALGLACQAAPDKSGDKSGNKSADAKPPEVAPPAVEAKPDQVSEAPDPSQAAPNPAPPWFDPAAFEHAAIIKQDTTGTRVASGQLSAMIVLELPPGTTAEQCIETARQKLGESIAELPANTTTPQGYLQLQGKADNYEYAVVCGVAKDKPTMFLSYTQ